MKPYHKEGLKWFEFYSLAKDPKITHGVLTRKGGYSLSPFDSLNLDLPIENIPEDISKNLSKVKHMFSLKNIVFSKQVHEANIVSIPGPSIPSKVVCDGLITNKKEVTLLIKHADCQAALFWDPIKQVIGGAHCGWRGNVLNIYSLMVDKMETLYGCEAKDILVCISPSLGPAFSEFKNYKEIFPKSFWDFQVQKDYFDLWAIGEKQLLDSGILKENIEIAKIDTYSSKEDFFSYRRDKRTGRNATFISLS